MTMQESFLAGTLKPDISTIWLHFSIPFSDINPIGLNIAWLPLIQSKTYLTGRRTRSSAEAWVLHEGGSEDVVNNENNNILLGEISWSTRASWTSDLLWFSTRERVNWNKRKIKTIFDNITASDRIWASIESIPSKESKAISFTLEHCLWARLREIATSNRSPLTLRIATDTTDTTLQSHWGGTVVPRSASLALIAWRWRHSAVERSPFRDAWRTLLSYSLPFTASTKCSAEQSRA